MMRNICKRMITNSNKTEMKKWKDIKLGDRFVDGSMVTEIHDRSEHKCYRVRVKKFGGLETDEIILSEDHMVLISLKTMSKETQRIIRDRLGSVKIPTEYDRHVKIDPLGFCHESLEVTAWDDAITGNNVWLTIKMIADLMVMGEKISYGWSTITGLEKIPGMKSCFCISTNTHRYESNGLIHHNSVTLRNILIHCMTHSDDMVLALVDLKQTEFTGYRGARGVLGVGTSIPEALEILRIAREVMYKRNKEMAKLGISNISHYKPKEYTGKISIFGREFPEDEKFQVKIDGREQTKTALEIFEILNNKEKN